jgi:hypothetical protein
MSADTYVYDLSSMPESNSSIFIRKDWLSLMDLNSTNYSSNVSTIATDSVANSSKWCNWYESTLLIPATVTLTPSTVAGAFAPATAATAVDYALGLKNSSLSIIHSMSVELNGSVVCQQIPYIALWNNFKLMCTMNLTDYSSMGSIGWAIDTATAVQYYTEPSAAGMGVCNNQNYINVNGTFTEQFASLYGNGNVGFLQRQNYYNFQPLGNVGTSTYNSLLQPTNLNKIYKSYITQPVNTSGGGAGYWQQWLVLQVRLRDVADLFCSMGLLRGIMARLIVSLNSCSFTFNVSNTSGTTGAAADSANTQMYVTQMNSAFGGINPLMLASAEPANGSFNLAPVGADGTTATNQYIASIAVGRNILNSTQSQLCNSTGSLLQSVTLTIPGYTMASSYEQAFISNPISRVLYSDLYQYTIYNIGSGQQFNQVISQGIVGAKEILMIPVFAQNQNNIGSTTAALNLPAFQSPFDSCGGGTTSPFCQIYGANVVLAGSNVIMTNELYMYQSYGQQLYGQVQGWMNAGLAAGSNSGLLNETDFFYSNCYYYVNIGRGLAVEDTIPKSISVYGTNLSQIPIDIYIFVSYQVNNLNIDKISGARV